MLSRQASVQIDNLQEQLQAIAAQRDRAVMDLASIQEQAHQYQTSLSNLQLVLEQFQRGMVCPLQHRMLKHCHSCYRIVFCCFTQNANLSSKLLKNRHRKRSRRPGRMLRNYRREKIN